MVSEYWILVQLKLIRFHKPALVTIGKYQCPVSKKIFIWWNRISADSLLYSLVLMLAF